MPFQDIPTKVPIPPQPPGTLPIPSGPPQPPPTKPILPPVSDPGFLDVPLPPGTPIFPPETPSPIPPEIPFDPDELEFDSGDELEAGEQPSDEEYEALELEADEYERGLTRTLAVSGTTPGRIIGTPGCGTHAVAAGCRWKSITVSAGCRFGDAPCNWQSANALDIALPFRAPITAVRDGIVSPGKWGYDPIGGPPGRFQGMRLHVVHPNGMVSFYTHLDELEVRKGQPVKRGDILGYSGIANGVLHLHFAVNPPFNPYVFGTDSYRLKGRKPRVPVPPAGPGIPEAIPGLTWNPPTVGRSWLEAMSALEYTFPAASRTIRATRQTLLDPLK